jgi:hypothetical protein
VKEAALSNCTGLSSYLSNSYAVLRSTSTYSGLIGFSLLIIMSVLTIVAVLYAVGTAFKIESLKIFSRNEILENVLNFIMIIFISAGIFAVDSLVSGLAQFGSSAVGSASTQQEPTSLTGIYQSICVMYYSDIINQIWNIISISLFSFVINIFSSIKIMLMPNGFGITFAPFAWYTSLSKMIGLFGAVEVAIAGIELVNIFLLSIIYYLFPIFLYLGILFRSFPWTRSIGGALLGLFISFYVFYPALLYAFSSIIQAYSQQIGSSISNQYYNIINEYYSSNMNSLTSLSGLSATSIFPETAIFITVNIAESGLNTLGILISLIICFDLIEVFGDLLGAPSLSHGGILRRLI